MQEPPGKYDSSPGEEETDGILPNLLGISDKSEIEIEEFKGILRAHEVCIKH